MAKENITVENCRTYYKPDHVSVFWDVNAEQWGVWLEDKNGWQTGDAYYTPSAEIKNEIVAELKAKYNL